MLKVTGYRIFGFAAFENLFKTVIKVKILWIICLMENGLLIVISPSTSHYVIKWTTAFKQDFNFTIELSKMYLGVIKTCFYFI